VSWRSRGVEGWLPADLVLLRTSPLDDIHDTRAIEAVVLSGRYLDGAALDALLAGAKTATGRARP
jgi:hypothetical protein